MITTTHGVALSNATLYPPPLLIHKKPRRATFRRRIFRESTLSQSGEQYVFGPLDDIIDEIKSDIWELPPTFDDSSVLDWAKPLEAPSTWTVTPLPVSRIPNEYPLTIRKNRNSRSTTSGSSMGDPMGPSRQGSQDQAPSRNMVRSSDSSDSTPWPLIDLATLYCETSASNPAISNVNDGPHTAQQTLEKVIRDAENQVDVTKRRPSRLRRLTNGFPRLRRMGTQDTNTSTADAPESASPTISVSPSAHDKTEDGVDAREPSDQAIEAYIKKVSRKYVSNFRTLSEHLSKPCASTGSGLGASRQHELIAHSGAKLGSIMKRIANRLPPSADHDHESTDRIVSKGTSAMPTTLRAAVRIFPQTKILTQDTQDISVAVDVEGVIYNRKTLPDATIDVIFVVDNGYYVTKACLEKALETVNGALYHLGRGDRMALYTTHCTHHTVSGNRPDLHYPLRPYCTDSDNTFRELTAIIARYGTQAWQPPRPNPSMTDVILGIMRSLGNDELKSGRTHVVLLSPVAHVLHDVSTHFPDLYVHCINPAIVPFRCQAEPQNTVCNDDCCKNVLVSNYGSYQSVPGRIKRLFKNARSWQPVGELTDLSIDIRARDGCELVECAGHKDIPLLRLGQVHTFFVRVRVTRSDTQGIDLESANPIFNSSLDVTNLRQQLQNVVAKGGVKIHLFDVQVFYRNSLNMSDCWNYTETPLLLVRELGGLAPPIDTAMEVYKRQSFRNFIQSEAPMTDAEVQEALATLKDDDELKRLLERMTSEADCHRSIREYEREHRQKLPLCPGPVELESSAHEWLEELWNKNKCKRKGVAVVKEEDITGLIEQFKNVE